MGSYPLPLQQCRGIQTSHSAQPGTLWLELHPEWVKGERRLRKTLGRCPSSYHPWVQHGADQEESKRVAGYERNLQADNWSHISELRVLAEAVEALHLLVQQGSYVDKSVVHGVVKRCVLQKEIVLGKRVHALAIRTGYESDTIVANPIIGMYASLGRLEDAKKVFTKVDAPNRYTWASIILAHAEHRKPREVIELYRQMRKSTVKADNRIFVALLKACGTAKDLLAGKEVHADILMTAAGANTFIGNCIVDMYAKCGSLGDARKFFDNQPNKDVVTWTAMIAGYARHRLGQEALTLYASMLLEAMTPPNKVTFVCLLQACTSIEDLHQGKQLHAQIKERGLEVDVMVANCLINMYAKCGSLEDARRVFDKLPFKDVVTWNSMMTGYAQHGLVQEALSLYANMQKEDTSSADNVTFICLLKACTNARALIEGKLLHAEIEKRRLAGDLVVGTCLVNMYSKCGCLDAARSVFENLASRNVVTWNAMIAGYAENGLGHEALHLYGSMQREGITAADAVTFVCLLQACASIGALGSGKQLHLQIEERGLQGDAVVGNCLVNMYSKCGSLLDARSVFDNLQTRNVVTWNAMISGYAQHGLGEEALLLYESMQAEGITEADAVTFVCLLQVCTDAAWLEMGRAIHSQISRTGLDEADVRVGNALIGMYSRCGSLDNARSVFHNLQTKDVVTWTVMIAGYTQEGLAKEALTLYASMQQENLTPPDAVAFICLLQACASVGALYEGKQLHAQIQERGLDADVVVGTCLVDMYAKCGSLVDACRVFSSLPSKSVVTWTSIIAGYAQQGLGQEALTVYEHMQQEGITPANAVTFACLLQACASVGGLHQGKQLHLQIRERGLEADVMVGTCLVDMYAKHGNFEDARTVFENLPSKSVVTWTAMIAGYVRYGQGQEAISIYERMQREETTPANAVTFLCLLQACGAVAGLEKGKEIHTQILKVGLECTDLRVANALIDMYAKCGSMVDAQHVFDGLSTRDIVTWNALSAGYAHHGESEMVFDLFHSMRQDDIHPDAITFLIVLTVCGHLGLVDKGERYFSAMGKDYGIAPTLEHYNCMVDLLGRAGQLEKVPEIVESMPFKPNGATWRCVLGSCQKWCNVELARHAFEHAVRLDKHDAAAYVLLSNIYAAAQMWEDSQKIQQMRGSIQACKKPGQTWWSDGNGIVHTFEVGDRECVVG